ncbi:MAG: energy transducer TonB [Candidatus Acidiferrum sp.]
MPIKAFCFAYGCDFSRILSRAGALLIGVLTYFFLSASAAAQDPPPALPPAAQAQMDSLATRVAAEIRASKIDPAYPKIFVIDFSNAGGNQFSKLGSVLADDFAESLSRLASGFQVEDRKSFSDYLKENLMGPDDLESEAVCLTLARSMGGSGVVRGTIETDTDQQLRVSLTLDGLGPAWTGDAQFPLTSALQNLLKQPAISFERPPDAVPTEPGVLRPGVDGASLPVCEFCPSPDYTELAQEAKYRGTVELSVVVTKNGTVESVVVLRGAPFALTQQAVETVQKWKFKPAKLQGRSVPVRVPVDIEFQLY